MQNIAQNAGVFNARNENGTDLFTLTSQTTRMGNRSHTITTKVNGFALSLFEEALNIDVAPDFAISKGFYVIEFIASDADCAEAIQAARQSRGVVTC